MRNFVKRTLIGLLLFLFALPSANAQLGSPCDRTSSFYGELDKLATLFCPKESCDENDFFSAETPQNIKEATVVVSRGNLCSGIVIKLKKGSRECRNPLLLTAGHCVAPYEKDKTIYVVSHKGSYIDVPSSKVLSLQNQCLNEDKTNCLVTPDKASKEEFNHAGVDQALMPLYSSYKKRGEITPYEIDLDKIANETELGACFKDPFLSVRITSALSPDHVEKMGIDSKVNFQNPSTYIKSHICKKLRWVNPHIFQGEVENFVKKALGHRCPTHGGMSGSFMELECKGKKGFFIHKGDRYRGANDEAKERAKSGGIIYSYEYEGRENFINEATQIDSKLFEFYFNNYCVSGAG